MVTGAFTSTPAPATAPAARTKATTTSMPVKPSAMNIKPVDLPPIERDLGEPR
jgi:hypothetical protein